jgi:tRNA-dihydrouridine synthase C
MKQIWIDAHTPALLLAPMEGVTDAPMRAFLTERGGFSFCVAEFLRVSQEVPPRKVFLRHVPEISNACRTPSGVPTQIQLLGGNAEKLAASAVRAYQIGATAIDLNFGCPAPTVNRHDGGATLLKHPERLTAIVAAVRASLPPEIPVSAKIRLGWENTKDVFRNAEAAEKGGASWVTIHARTRLQGYAPPAYWDLLGEVKKNISIPIVANGDIWTREDFLRCRDASQCKHVMIGRGALADPSLAHVIAYELGIAGFETRPAYPFGVKADAWEPLFRRFYEHCRPFQQGPQFTPQKIKQWINFTRLKTDVPWFDVLKRAQTMDEVYASLKQH